MGIIAFDRHRNRNHSGGYCVGYRLSGMAKEKKIDSESGLVVNAASPSSKPEDFFKYLDALSANGWGFLMGEAKFVREVYDIGVDPAEEAPAEETAKTEEAPKEKKPRRMIQT